LIDLHSKDFVVPLFSQDHPVLHFLIKMTKLSLKMTKQIFFSKIWLS